MIDLCRYTGVIRTFWETTTPTVIDPSLIVFLAFSVIVSQVLLLLLRSTRQPDFLEPVGIECADIGAVMDWRSHVTITSHRHNDG